MRLTLSVSLALAALLALALTACAPAALPNKARTLIPKPADDTTVTRASQIYGVWRVYSTHCSPGFMLVRNNGTFAWSCSRDGTNGISGKYHFSNGRFVILNDFCGEEGRYEIRTAPGDPHTLTFTLVQDTCAVEVDTLTRQQVSWDSALP